MELATVMNTKRRPITFPIKSDRVNDESNPSGCVLVPKVLAKAA